MRFYSKVLSLKERKFLFESDKWWSLLPKLRKILANYYIQFQIKVKIERGRKKSL